MGRSDPRGPLLRAHGGWVVFPCHWFGSAGPPAGPSRNCEQRSGAVWPSACFQAFQQEHLERSGRSHGLEDVEDALAALREADVPSWSLDLMSGLPHLSVQQWRESLRRALEARPDHVSVYDLQVTPPPPFRRAVDSWRAALRPGLQGGGLSTHRTTGSRLFHLRTKHVVQRKPFAAPERSWVLGVEPVWWEAIVGSVLIQAAGLIGGRWCGRLHAGGAWDALCQVVLPWRRATAG
jgi:hypothetical protein